MEQGISLGDLVTQAFDAAVDDSLWPKWFETLARRMGGTSTLAAMLDSEQQTLIRPIATWGPAKAYEEYFSGYWQHDPQISVACAFRGQGIYMDFANSKITTPDMIDYVKWQKSIACIDRHMTAVIPLSEAGERVTFSVHRAPGLGPVDQAVMATFAEQLPSIAHAVRLGFSHQELLQQTFWEGLVAARRDQDAILLNEHGKVMRYTPGIDLLAVSQDGIVIRQGRLFASCERTDPDLQKALFAAMQLQNPRPGAMRLPRPSGGVPLLLTIYPLQRSARRLAPLEAATLIMLHHPGQRRSDHR